MSDGGDDWERAHRIGRPIGRFMERWRTVIRKRPWLNIVYKTLITIIGVAVVIVGLDAEWESEGYDRQTMAPPSEGSQDRLIEAVVQANPRTVVVNQAGTPVTMPWVDQVPAIIQGWYQGQEAGNALADVLFGIKNPSGKLPVSLALMDLDHP